MNQIEEGGEIHGRRRSQPERREKWSIEKNTLKGNGPQPERG